MPRKTNTDGVERDLSAPQGRERIPIALIAACERLCSTSPPSSVSVRDIATEARVTTGLVHHYFDSKDALVAAALRSMAEEVNQTAEATLAETGDMGEVARAVWRFGVVRPAFTMIVSWWLLEGKNVSEAMGEHPFLRSLARALGAPGRDDALTDAGVIAAACVGFNTLHPGFSRALGREPGDQRLVDAMEDAVVEMARAAAARSDSHTA